MSAALWGSYWRDRPYGSADSAHIERRCIQGELPRSLAGRGEIRRGGADALEVLTEDVGESLM